MFEVENVYIVALNGVPFIPYVGGLLRSYADTDAEVASRYRFREFFFLTQPLAAIVGAVESPAIVGLSCYVWNFKRHMKLARLLKERSPEVLIVAGGPHIPDRVDNFFDNHPYVDILVHGEGEIAFLGILRERLRAAPDWSRVPGITFREGLDVRSTGIGQTLPRSIDTASPYLQGYLDDAIELCRARQLRFYALWETNRGCPYSCAFCDWGSATMSKLRRFDIDRLMAEVEFFGLARIPNVFICDANFGILDRDVVIANGLAESHHRYGFPQQVRVNFAKNSNDRVFAISKVFSENDMLMGTTLSMQSTSLEVLDAINRRNIGVDNYRLLKERYSRNNIHTYTELILGLPLESRESFIKGIGDLLAAGNHEDLRVYELMILPNAPMNEATTLNRYGIKLVERPLYIEAPGTPEDEIETASVAVETNSMSRADWVRCAVFAQSIQFLHNGCFARYIAIYLNRALGVRFDEFYERLINFGLARPESLLGRIFTRLELLYMAYQDEAGIPISNIVASQPDMAASLDKFGRRRGWTVDDWGWLCIAVEQDRFYVELREFVDDLIGSQSNQIDELFRYQSDLMLRLDYDPARGKRTRYRFDWPSYYTRGEALRPRPVTVHYKDTHMGVNRQYPLEPGNAKSFARAAIGESYPFSRIRHFQHQLDAATVEYETETDLIRPERGVECHVVA